MFLHVHNSQSGKGCALADQLMLDIPVNRHAISRERVANPEAYTGLYGFHKYWGKKPHETVAYLIEQLTNMGEVVADPFLGAGTVGREALLRSRRFIGMDLNPVAVEIARLLAHPPDVKLLRIAIREVESRAKQDILGTYKLADGRIASHFLWEGDLLKEVWVTEGRRGRLELRPTQHDLNRISSFGTYMSRHIRALQFFDNARINARPSMHIGDLFTRRAQHNIDLLMDAMLDQPEEIARVLRLCLTAASGQMSSMVFSITGRGKTTGNATRRVEVGSWVIGYWRPGLHFEINAWNCFERRAQKLIKALSNGDPLETTELTESIPDFMRGEAHGVIKCIDCREALSQIPDGAVSLVVTDPPHSDRIPYLELSEMWNSIIGANADFGAEVVVSNARERRKNAAFYDLDMRNVFREVGRVLQPDGHLALLFNARRQRIGCQ